MIPPKDISVYMEKAGTNAGTMARKLGISLKRFENEVLLNGLTSPHEIELFNLILKNDKEAEEFSFSEINEFQEIYGLPDYVMCLYLGVATSTYSNMKAGKPISPSIRKAFKALRLLQSEGYDIKRYIAEA